MFFMEQSKFLMWAFFHFRELNKGSMHWLIFLGVLEIYLKTPYVQFFSSLFCVSVL